MRMIKKYLAQKSRMLSTLVHYTVLLTFTYSPNFLGFEEEGRRGILKNVIKTKYLCNVGPGDLGDLYTTLISGCVLYHNM